MCRGARSRRVAGADRPSQRAPTRRPRPRLETMKVRAASVIATLVGGKLPRAEDPHQQSNRPEGECLQ